MNLLIFEFYLTARWKSPKWEQGLDWDRMHIRRGRRGHEVQCNSSLHGNSWSQTLVVTAVAPGPDASGQATVTNRHLHKIFY